MSRKSLVVGLLLAGAALAATGCVERRVIIRSEPVGARLLLDLEEVPGRTPVELPVEHGGTRHVTLIAPGHEVLEGEATVVDPWFTWFPIDIFTELLWPGTLEDVQEFDFALRAYPDHLTPEDEAALEARIAAFKARAAAHRAGGSAGPGGSAAPETVDEPPPPPPPASGSEVPLPPTSSPPRIGR